MKLLSKKAVKLHTWKLSNKQFNLIRQERNFWGDFILNSSPKGQVLIYIFWLYGQQWLVMSWFNYCITRSEVQSWNQRHIDKANRFKIWGKIKKLLLFHLTWLSYSYVSKKMQNFWASWAATPARTFPKWMVCCHIIAPKRGSKFEDHLSSYSTSCLQLSALWFWLHKI